VRLEGELQGELGGGEGGEGGGAGQVGADEAAVAAGGVKRDNAGSSVRGGEQYSWLLASSPIELHSARASSAPL
jgi:hypothetical protein